MPGLPSRLGSHSRFPSLGSRARGRPRTPWAFLTAHRASTRGPSCGAGPRVAASAVAVSRGRSRGRSYKRAAARGGSTWRWLPPGRFRHALEPAAFPARRSRGMVRAPVVWSLRLNLRCPTYQAARATRRTPSRYRLGSVPTARRRRCRWPARGAPPPARRRPAILPGSATHVSAEIRSNRVRGYLVDSLQF